MKRKSKIAARIRLNRILIAVTVCCLIVVGSSLLMNLYREAVTTFFHTDADLIDISKDLTGGIPRFYQTDSRWANRQYGTNVMGMNGCGPTCLSMVYCGLTGDTKWTPYEVAKMAQKRGYYFSGVGTSWDLMTDGAKRLGLKGEQVLFTENAIRSELENGNPIICAVGPGDFTTEGHFIVLTGMTDDGKILVNDPNSRTLSDKQWELERLMSQMKNLWSYRVIIWGNIAWQSNANESYFHRPRLKFQDLLPKASHQSNQTHISSKASLPPTHHPHKPSNSPLSLLIYSKLPPTIRS